LPELPEVETIRRALLPRLAGSRVEAVAVRARRAVVGDPAAFAAAVTGRTIVGLDRRGKYLLFTLDEGRLVAHLRMSGRLLLRAREEGPGPHTRLQIWLAGRGRLDFDDPRQFGHFLYVPRGGRLPDGLRALGPEPLSSAFTTAYLTARLAGRRAPIKALLLDQRIVAGVGNIYADESLHAAGIHPARPGGSLTAAEVERLRRALRRTLRAALAARGTTFRDYVDVAGATGGYAERLRVFRRQGEPCRRCGSILIKTRVAGRGTHLCPRCQPEEA
jgi:formamidopyrimidine-DNA glycosylase